MMIFQIVSSMPMHILFLVLSSSLKTGYIAMHRVQRLKSRFFSNKLKIIHLFIVHIFKTPHIALNN